VRLLILGGTQFLGRHIAEAAAAEGHEVTCSTGATTRMCFRSWNNCREIGKTPLYGRWWDHPLLASTMVYLSVNPYNNKLPQKIRGSLLLYPISQ
jgi:hypothetical protein